ncbi:hypothetical protein D3C83_266270 [compost metagenome]
MFRIETDVDRLRVPQAADEKAGNNQQHERAGDLRDHQRAAQPRASAAGRPAAAAVMEQIRDLGA